MYTNNLLQNVAQNRLTTAVGIKSFPVPEMVYLAKHAGYDSVFIDLEHTTVSVKEASNLCMHALKLNVTPFVRVPHQSGDGLIQRVLDAGAMGIIVPHVDTAEQAQKVARIAKYPPLGGRSLASGYAHFDLAPVPLAQIVEQLNESGSTVFVQIETKAGLANVDAIAATSGVDVLLVGANDLSLELGVVGQLEHPSMISALEEVGRACKTHGKIFGVAGIYSRKDLMDMLVKKLGARWVLVGNDQALMLNMLQQSRKDFEQILER